LNRQGDNSVESLGPRLKREREQRKITLDEISLSTKIATRFLLAIEEEHFDQLPGGIFNKGFIRAYARSVGVDELQAVADYELASGANLPPPETAAGGSPSLAAVPDSSVIDQDSGSGASRVPWGWFVVALLVVAVGLAVWGFYSRERSAKPVPPPPVPRDSAAVAPLSVAQTRSAPSPATGDAVPSATNKTPPSQPPAASSSPAAFLVQIKATQDSWVAISADGREIMQDTLYASAEKSVGARDQIVIKTGNAGALDISFNGKRLPAQGGLHEVKTLTFDPAGPRP
jgi:cytoskeleton protein RodZ